MRIVAVAFVVAVRSSPGRRRRPSCRSSTRTCITATTRGTTCRRRTRSRSCARPGIKRALVSSSGDEGTQRLVAEAPDLVLPSLRPYRTRGDVATWVRDESVVAFLEDRLARQRYVAIGEFHLYGADADLPVPRRMVALARQHGLVLHAHSDAGRDRAPVPPGSGAPASSGRTRDSIAPSRSARCSRKHRNLWCDLAFRSEQGAGGKVPAEWRAVFTEFPDRFMVGTDTYTPERWHYIVEHAAWSRAWLADLPPRARRAHRLAQRRRAVRRMDARAQPMKRLRGIAVLGRPACRCAPATAGACGEALRGATRTIEGASYIVAFRTVPDPIAVGAHFALDFAVCPRATADAPRARCAWTPACRSIGTE